MNLPAALEVPQRTLMGPGPSDVAPSVLNALSKPTLGHLDPLVLRSMDELAAMLRALYGTSNAWTFATSGTGTSGMECVLANVIRPQDRVLVIAHGYFGLRMAEIARRAGAEVIVAEGEWGRPSAIEDVRKVAAGRRFAALCAVHAETSTGVLQDLSGLRGLADELGALLVVDAVTSLGCVPVRVDEDRIDAVYSCSQKGLSCTPGLSPVSFSAKAVERTSSRAAAPHTFYLDASALADYWGGPRGYHHTASSNLYYALHEAVRLVLSEGLEARWKRHAQLGSAMAAGLEALGLEMVVPAAHRLPQLAVVRIPAGVEDAQARKFLLERYHLEIGGGLGPFRGRVWRIGLMGGGASVRNLTLCLAALAAALRAQGFAPRGDGVAAALAALS